MNVHAFRLLKRASAYPLYGITTETPCLPGGSDRGHSDSKRITSRRTRQRALAAVTADSHPGVGYGLHGWPGRTRDHDGPADPSPDAARNRLRPRLDRQRV